LPIRQGDLYWLQAGAGSDSEVGAHPYLVIQEDVLNDSRITTVVVCALTSNLKQAPAPGNVLLEEGEGGLPHRSAVVISKVSTVEKSRLGDRIGALSPERVEQVLAGMKFLQRSTARNE
jgi:mRNA interferase MazF